MGWSHPLAPLVLNRQICDLLSLLLLGLMVFPPLWFMGWFINWLRRRPRDKRWLVRLGPWVEVLLVVLAVTFVALQFKTALNVSTQ
jgi:hypothetical protein